MNYKKRDYRLMAALAVLLFIFGLSYFAGNDESVLNFKPSVEVGIFSLSPSGPSGGRIIPASCPSYEHTPGECTPAPTADIRANAGSDPINDPNWVNGSNGPLNILIGAEVTVTWNTTGGGGAVTYTCNVTKNSGACGLGSDSCTALDLDPATYHNSGFLLSGTYNYTIVCTDSLGRGASDVVF